MSTTLQTIDEDGNKIEDVKEGASIIGGGLLMLYGLMRRDLVGVLCTVGGAGMVVSCAAKRTAGTWAAVTSIEKFPIPLLQSKSDKKVKCKRATTIAKPVEEVYQFLSKAENFAQFMQNVYTIRPLADDGYEWHVKSLSGGDLSWKTTLERNDVTKELTFHSLVDSEAGGTVRVTCLPIQKSNMKDATEVHVELDYHRPNVKVVATIFHLLGKDPAHQMEGDLAALKQLLEAGEIATNHI
jgi:uncharacterized membrane protein